MADLKLVRVTKGDTQEVFIDKLNQNFGRILSSGGGTYGKTGEEGTVGPNGPIGPTGDFGPQGQSGSRWFVSNSEPIVDTTGLNDGDHWVVSTNDFKDYILENGVWSETGLFLTGSQFFTQIDNIINRSGEDIKNAIIEFTENPSSTTMVISDSLVNSSFGNTQYSKMLISTQGQLGKHILEFSKSEFQDGGQIDASKHPYFTWEFVASPDDYSLIWGMTGGGFNLTASKISLNSSTSDLSIYSPGDISLSSSSSLFQFSKGNIEFSTANDFTLISDSTSIGPTGLSLSGSLKVSTDSSTVPGLTSDSFSEDSGNVRVNYLSPNGLGVNDSEISLIRIDHTDFAKPILDVDGDGETTFSNLSQSYNQESSVLSGTTGPYTQGSTGYYVNWISFSPAPVGSPSQRTYSPSNLLIVSPVGPTGSGTISSPYNGVSLFGAYGSNIGSNALGRLIADGRSFSITVTAPTSAENFRAVGIGTLSNPSSAFPNQSLTNEWQILPHDSDYVTFHVMRLPDTGATGNWRVFYETNKYSGVLYES